MIIILKDVQVQVEENSFKILFVFVVFFYQVFN